MSSYPDINPFVIVESRELSRSSDIILFLGKGINDIKLQNSREEPSESNISQADSKRSDILVQMNKVHTHIIAYTADLNIEREIRRGERSPPELKTTEERTAFFEQVEKLGIMS